MFTGLVEEIGTLRAVGDAPSARRLEIDAPTVSAGAARGDSIAVNGVCLTVVEVGPGWWAAEAVPETLARSNLGALRPGDPVNLERPLRPDGRLGGHLVQGHVDGTGTVVSPAPELLVAYPSELAPYLVEKGSVTVDGVSLTVARLDAAVFGVAVVPHTAAVTTLGAMAAGALVNLEVDVIAKYVQRLLAAGADTPYRSGASASSER